MPNDVEKLKQIKCFVFDMDGTLYLSDRILKGAKETIDFLVSRSLALFYFTNNSSKSVDDYVNKLNRLGLQNNGANSVMTSGNVTAAHMLSVAQNPRAYVCGTVALKTQFRQKGITVVEEPNQAIDFAVLAFDTELTYEKLTILTDYVVAGVPYIATNTDDVCPLDGGGFLVDCRSMAKMIENACGKAPTYMGKPAKATVDYIVDRTGCQPQQIAIVGDRLYTDMQTAKNGGLVSIAVLSGDMTNEVIEKSEIKIDMVYDGIADLLKDLMAIHE